MADRHEPADVQPSPALGSAGVEPQVASTVEADFETLYGRHYRHMVGLAALLVDDVDCAEEVVQDAFVSLHRNWSTVSNPVGYLHRCVVNGGRDVQRRRTVRRRAVLPPPTSAILDVNHLDDVVATLPHRQRVAIVLRYCEGLGDEQIAAALEVAPNTVRTLVRRGLSEIRRQVER